MFACLMSSHSDKNIKIIQQNVVINGYCFLDISYIFVRIQYGCIENMDFALDSVVKKF